jgi:ribosomal protein S17
MSEQEKSVRTLTGKVVSNKMDKTITVSVERMVTQDPASPHQDQGARREEHLQRG